MKALQIITEEHRRLWRVVIAVDRVVDELEAHAEGEAMAAPERVFFAAVFDYLDRFVDRAHHAKEDDYLFRHLRRRHAPAAALLERLEAEHYDQRQTLTDLRNRLTTEIQGDREVSRALADFADFAAAVRGYTQGLREHIRREEKELLPLARQHLHAEDWNEIDAAFTDNDDPLFGTSAREEFRALYHRLASLAPESVGLGGQGGMDEGGAGDSGVSGIPFAAPSVAAEIKEKTREKTREKEASSAEREIRLKIENVSSNYGRIKALKGIDLEIHAGELVALVGANGAGKTTLLRVISGVQPIASGRLFFEGAEITRLRSDRRVRRGICQVPEGRQVFGPMSIEDNLLLGAYCQPKRETAREMERIYALFPILKEKRKLPAGTLSGGQQQMLAIGRALMGRPRLLLLDEPSMGLAPLLVEEVFDVVKTLKNQGITIFLVEQNAFAALAIADRGYVLETGNTILSGSGEELLHDEQVRAAYLGM